MIAFMSVVIFHFFNYRSWGIETASNGVSEVPMAQAVLVRIRALKLNLHRQDTAWPRVLDLPTAI